MLSGYCITAHVGVLRLYAVSVIESLLPLRMGRGYISSDLRLPCPGMSTASGL